MFGEISTIGDIQLPWAATRDVVAKGQFPKAARSSMDRFTGITLTARKGWKGRKVWRVVYS